jgi:hypothetical protein
MQSLRLFNFVTELIKLTLLPMKSRKPFCDTIRSGCLRAWGVYSRRIQTACAEKQQQW